MYHTDEDQIYAALLARADGIRAERAELERQMWRDCYSF